MKKIISLVFVLVVLCTASAVCAQSDGVVMELYSNDALCENGMFYAGELTLNGHVTAQLSKGEALAVIAQYDETGALMDVAVSRNIVDEDNTTVTATLNSVDDTGIVKCLVIDSQTLEPLCQAQVYAAYDSTMTIWSDMLDCAANLEISKQNPFAIEYYASVEAANAVKIYMAANPVVTVNGVAADCTDLTAFVNIHAKIQFSETTNDMYYDSIDITVYEYAIVSGIQTDKQRIILDDGSWIQFDFDNLLQSSEFYDKNGAASTFGNIAAGDVLAMVVGELNDTTFLPVAARSFENKITVYNMGKSYIVGKVVGWDYNYGQFYIDDVPYAYYPGEWITYDTFDDFLGQGPLGEQGKFYLGMDSKIIGYDGTGYRDMYYGFIIQGAVDHTGFDASCQLKILTENEGVVVYDVATKAQINGIDCDTAFEQEAYLSMYEFDLSTMASAAYNRIVKYKVNSKNEIYKIQFVSSTDYCDVMGKYNSSINSIDGKQLTENAVIFNVDCPDSDYAYVTTAASFLEMCEYEGYVVYNGRYGYDLMVITNGEFGYDASQPLCIVDNAIAYLYEDQEAWKVFYYTAGSSGRKSIMFTDDSEAIYGNYANLSKGSLFVAMAGSDGIADEYAVMGIFDSSSKELDIGQYIYENVYGSQVTDSIDSGVAYIYGYISDISMINGKTVINVAGRDIVIDDTTAQYCYNTDGSRDVINVGDFMKSKNVDGYYDGKATLVYVKLYNGVATDIISISDRKSVADENVAVPVSSSHYEATAE